MWSDAPMLLTRISSAAIALTLGSTLAGCGDDERAKYLDQSAETIVDDAVAAMKEVESVRLEADVNVDDMDIGLDLALTTSGDCTGTIGLDGNEAEIRALDGTSWFRAEDEFWRSSFPDNPEQADTIIETVGGKWVLDESNQFASFCDLDEFLKGVAERDEGEKLAKGDESEVDGQDVIEIEGKTKEGDPSKVSVSLDEPHYILAVSAEGQDVGSATFSNFDEDVEVEAPAEDEVVDLSSP